MNSFFSIKHDTLININKIREISIERNDAVRITFDDGSTDVYSTSCDASQILQEINKTIVQISPCSIPLYNVYENDDGGYFHERVSNLALCADGNVRSLSGCEYFDLAEDSSNFVGCFDETCFKEYPESIGDTADE